MKKNRLVFYAVFALFHIILVIITIYVDANKNDVGSLFGLLKWISFAKYAALLGLLLLIVDLFWNNRIAKENEKEKAALAHELNMLKAKLFDLQEAERKGVQQKPNTNT